MLRLKRLGLAVAAVFVSLELLLQLGALCLFWLYAPGNTAPAPDTRGEILCIGDSYTFGVGASAPASSYPGQLQTRLDEHSLALRVVNAGFPGQHSADLARRLSAQISAQTRAVCVLVGTNDAWRRPAPLPPTEVGAVAASTAAPGFEWTWRTGRLLELLSRFTWFSWEQQAGSPPQAKPSNPAVSPQSRERIAEVVAGYELIVAAGMTVGTRPPVLPRDSMAPPQGWQDSIWKHVRAGDLEGAVKTAQEFVDAHPGSPSALQSLAQVATRAGMRDLALTTVAQLESRFEETRDPAAEEALCIALADVGRTEDAHRAAKARLADEPGSVGAAFVFLKTGFSLGSFQEAKEVLPRAIDLMGTNRPWQTASVLADFVRMTHEEDPERAAQLLVASYLIEPSIETARIVTLKIERSCPAAMIVRVLRGLDLPESKSIRDLLTLLEDEEDQQWRETLTGHLELILHAAQTHGAKVVVLSYPFHQPEVEDTQRAFAAQHGLPFLAIRERFGHELTTLERADLFVADGHCNDRGYGIMAEEVANVLVPMLRD
ncbi:MAG: GDSL-type esterase/lipase family protein [Planctomycetota bacterium]